MAIRAENLRLRRLVEIGADLQGVAAGQRQAPADSRIARGDFYHALEEGTDVEFVAAEPARLQAAVKARFGKLVVDVEARGALDSQHSC